MSHFGLYADAAKERAKATFGATTDKGDYYDDGRKWTNSSGLELIL
jgi:hypothetical protein